MNENQNEMQDGGRSAASPTSQAGKQEELPQPNPFRTRTWNLTQQALLLKREPQKGERLQAEAVAEGEHQAPWGEPDAVLPAGGFLVRAARANEKAETEMKTAAQPHRPTRQEYASEQHSS